MNPIQKRYYLTSTTHRLSVCLSGKVFDRVMETSTYQGRSASNLCAYLIERGLDALQPATPRNPVLNRLTYPLNPSTLSTGVPTPEGCVSVTNAPPIHTGAPAPLSLPCN
jgi:hypothetical protein